MTEADLPIFFEHQLDPEATHMAAFPARDRDAFMGHWKTNVLPDESVIMKTILFEGRVAGNVLSWDQAGVRLVGYWIGRSYGGRGVATRALAEFLGQVPARPLHAHVAKHDLASLRVLEKCGFTVSGEDTVTSDGPVGEVKEFLLRLDA